MNTTNLCKFIAALPAATRDIIATIGFPACNLPGLYQAAEAVTFEQQQEAIKLAIDHARKYSAPRPALAAEPTAAAGPGPFGCDPAHIDFHGTAKRVFESTKGTTPAKPVGELIALFSLIFASGYNTGKADAERAATAQRRPTGL